MSTLTDSLVRILTGKYNLDLVKKNKFFDTPDSLKLLNETALKSLREFAEKLGIDLSKLFPSLDLDNLNDIKNKLRESDAANAILTASSDATDNDILNQLLIKCECLNSADPGSEAIEALKLLEEIEIGQGAESFIAGLEEASDLANELRAQIENYANQALDTLLPYAAAALLVFYIIKLIIDTLTNTDFPSRFRIKYIGRLIRNTLAGIWEIPGTLWENLKSMLKKMDILAVAVALTTVAYLYFLKESQADAEKDISALDCSAFVDKQNELLDIDADGSYDTPDNPMETTGDVSEVDCELVNIDEEIVPIIPYLSQLEGFNCEIAAEEAKEEEIEGEGETDLVTGVIIDNRTENPLIPILTIGDQVTTQTIIGTLGDRSVYAPMDGYISTFDSSIVTLSDTTEPEEDFLSSNINALNEKYTEQNNLKMFLKKWYVVSLYPIMMGKSPLTDGEYTKEEKDAKKYNSMRKRFDKIKKEWQKINDNYEKNIKKLTGGDNVETHCEDETLEQLKQDIDNEEEQVNKYLRTIRDRAVNIAKVTKPKSNEFEMIEYYLFELSLELNAIKEPNEYEKTYRDEINKFVNQRYVIDGWEPEKIEEKGNELLDDLEKGITLGNWWQKGVEKYKENKKMSDVDVWLINLGDENTKLEDLERELLISKLSFLYEFYFNIEANTEEYKDLKEADNKEQVEKEGSYIANFFGTLWKRFEDLPEEIKEIEIVLDDLAIFSPYTIYTDPSTLQQSRYYILIPASAECFPSGSDGGVEAGFSDYTYWLKYCTFATLASVLNPVKGWSTGWLGPPKPIKFPTIYIPIKPIATQYGFIVIGLTITGIWFFPMVLMVNYSTGYAMPILDPTSLVKNQIEKLKKKISKSLSALKTTTLEKYLKNKKKEIAKQEKEVENVSKDLEDHKAKRVADTKKNEEKYLKWKTELTKIQIEEKEVKLELFKLQTQHQIVQDSIRSGIATKTNDVADKGLKSIQDSESLINKQFDALDSLADKLDNIVAPLPTTLKPNTANFGITLKKPIPVVSIDSEIDDNINQEGVDKIADKFEVNNESFMSKKATFDYSKYLTALSAGALAGLSFKGVLDLLKSGDVPGLVTQDPFPAYENLTVTNIPWVKFLYTDYVPTGAKIYGFPGQLPL